MCPILGQSGPVWSQTWHTSKDVYSNSSNACQQTSGIRGCVVSLSIVNRHFSVSYSGGPDLDQKCVRIAPNGTNPGLFPHQISVHFGAALKCTKIWYEKIPDLSHLGPIWPILGAKSGHPGIEIVVISLHFK